MIISTKPVCTNPIAYADLARKFVKGIATFTDMLSPPITHSSRNGIVSIPQKLQYGDKGEREEEVYGYTYGTFGLNPLLEEFLAGPFSDELRDLGSYDLALTPVLSEIKDPPNVNKAFKPEELGIQQVVPSEEEANDEKEPRELGLQTADLRAFIKYKTATTVDELIQNPYGCATPTLLMTHPSFILAVITACGQGLKSKDPNERLGALNLIVKLLSNTYEGVLKAKTINEEFENCLLALRLIKIVLKEAKKDINHRVRVNAFILSQLTFQVSSKAFEIQQKLSKEMRQSA